MLTTIFLANLNTKKASIMAPKTLNEKFIWDEITYFLLLRSDSYIALGVMLSFLSTRCLPI